jgi:AraC-like DNA-binding protein
VLFRADGVQSGRLWPSADLAPFVEHYWWARWRLRKPHVTEIISYPSVHVVFEAGQAEIVGVVRAKFTRTLEGRGEVFAIKFQPGMFRLWSRAPVVRLTDRVSALGAQLGTPGPRLARAVLAARTTLHRARVVERHLRAAAPPFDREAGADARLARDLVTRVRTDPSLRSVNELSAVSGLGVRALQRLFRECVGVGPKWVVRRFRLQEAAELLKQQGQTIASVAASLGYFDQAHFVRDFKATVGSTPLDYRRKARDAGPSRARPRR